MCDAGAELLFSPFNQLLFWLSHCHFWCVFLNSLIIIVMFSCCKGTLKPLVLDFPQNTHLIKNGFYQTEFRLLQEFFFKIFRCKLQFWSFHSVTAVLWNIQTQKSQFRFSFLKRYHESLNYYKKKLKWFFLEKYI